MRNRMTVAAFALALGNNDRLTLDQSLSLHNAFRRAKDEDKAETRLDFIVSYLQGNLKIGRAAATKIAEKDRDSRSKVQQQSYDRARAKFSYHIERPKPVKAKPETGVWAKLADDVSSINSLKNKLDAAGRQAFHKALAALVEKFEAQVEE